MDNLFETIKKTEYFKKLLQIVNMAGMEELLTIGGPFTIFAPYDGAFDTFTTYRPGDILHEYPQIMLKDIIANKKVAQDSLNYLLVPGRLPLSELLTRGSITARNGQDIPITTTNGNIIPGNSFILNHDIECLNGIIHVTDEVLQPTLI